MLTNSLISSAMSLTASFSSNAQNLKTNEVGNWTIQTTFSGTPSGTLAFYVSNDENRYEKTPSNWTFVSSTIFSTQQTVPHFHLSDAYVVGWVKTTWTTAVTSSNGTMSSSRICF